MSLQDLSRLPGPHTVEDVFRLDVESGNSDLTAVLGKPARGGRDVVKATSVWWMGSNIRRSPLKTNDNCYCPSFYGNQYYSYHQRHCYCYYCCCCSAVVVAVVAVAVAAAAAAVAVAAAVVVVFAAAAAAAAVVVVAAADAVAVAVAAVVVAVTRISVFTIAILSIATFSLPSLVSAVPTSLSPS